MDYYCGVDYSGVLGFLFWRVLLLRWETLIEMRRSERRRDFEEKLGSLKKITNVNKGRGMKKLKVEYAMKELDIHWHAGLDEDLKEKTVKEIFSLLMPSAGSKQGDKKKGIIFKFGKLKKDH